MDVGGSGEEEEKLLSPGAEGSAITSFCVERRRRGLVELRPNSTNKERKEGSSEHRVPVHPVHLRRKRQRRC